MELFYLDASWYEGSSLRGTGDWGKGLGSYKEDRKKFPRGLRYLSDRVHAAGMKFGLWVGPNIVDAALVPGLIPQGWLAQTGGKRNQITIPAWEHPAVQVCLGSPEYTEHLKRELTRLVGEYNLDWIKWDNSGIPGSPAHCDRADHGHAAGDGSAAALRNEYAVFAHLHEKFPSLTLETVWIRQPARLRASGLHSSQLVQRYHVPFRARPVERHGMCDGLSLRLQCFLDCQRRQGLFRN